MYVCTYVCIICNACIHVCMHTCTYVCTYVWKYLCMYMCVYQKQHPFQSLCGTFPHHSASLSVASHSPNVSYWQQQKQTSQRSYSLRTHYFLPQACRLSFVYLQQRNDARTWRTVKRTIQQQKRTYRLAEGDYFICQRSFVTCCHYCAVRMRGSFSCLS